MTTDKIIINADDINQMTDVILNKLVKLGLEFQSLNKIGIELGKCSVEPNARALAVAMYTTNDLLIHAAFTNLSTQFSDDIKNTSAWVEFTRFVCELIIKVYKTSSKM